MGKLNGKVAIITGAGAGIGEATAKLFAKEGAKVICCDLLDTGENTVKEIVKGGGVAAFVKGDVSKEADAQNIITTAINIYKQIDVLANIAGIVIPGRVDNCSVEDWDKTMAINVRSVFLLSKFALPYLKKTKGSIINISSSVALKGVKDRGSYTASKGAVLSLTRAMAADYIDDGVRVNAICPGTTATPSLEQRIAKAADPEKAKIDLIGRQPMKRLGKPEEIADAILFFATNEFTTGAFVSVDGGMVNF